MKSTPKVTPAQQAVLDMIAEGNEVTAIRLRSASKWSARVYKLGTSHGVLMVTLDALVSRGLIVCEEVSSTRRDYSLPVTEQPMPEQQQAEALPVAVADAMRAEQDAQQRAYNTTPTTIEQLDRRVSRLRREREDARSVGCVALAAEITLEIKEAQGHADALMLEHEAAQAFDAEMQARHAEEDAARALELARYDLTTIVLDSTPVRPGSFIRQAYCDTPGADKAAWQSANRQLRAEMAQAAMREANRIKGSAKYLGLKHFFSFTQATPSELQALRVAILGGLLTPDWECASYDDAPAIAQPLEGLPSVPLLSRADLSFAQKQAACAEAGFDLG